MVDGRFLATFLDGGREQCVYMLIHVQLPYTVINVQDGSDGGEFQTLQNLESSENLEFF